MTPGHPHNRNLLDFISLERLVLLCSVVLFYSDVFSGVLRYSWHVLGLEVLTYIPMLSVVAIVFIYLAYSGFRTVYDTRICLVVFFLFAYGIAGLFMGRSFAGVLMALYSWSPFVLGMLVMRFDLFSKVMRHVPALILCALAGVLVTYLTAVPWMGAEGYRIGDVEVEITRNWDAFGISRLPGFSKASFTVANHLSFFVLWFMCTRRSVWLKVAVWGAATYAILVTTSKTPLIVIITAPVLLLIYTGLGKTRRWSNRIQPLYSQLVVIGLLAIMIGLPLGGEINRGNGRVHLPYDDIFPFLRIESFTQRVEGMWPNAFNLLDLDGAWAHFMGRGLGGIGVGQQFTELAFSNSGDNLHVYLYITFGVFSCLFYAVLLFGHKRASQSLRMSPASYLATVIAVLGLGTLTCVIESIVPVFAFGAAVALCIAPANRTRKADPNTLEWHESVRYGELSTAVN